MATYTAGDQINRALRLLGVLAEGETPSAQTSADALMALNQMIDSWNTERLSVFSTLDQTVTWPAGQATNTLGPSDTLAGTNVRPVLVEGVYYVSNGESYPVSVINQDQYDQIPDKTATGDPEVVFVNPTAMNATLTVYPVPTRNLEMHVVSARELTQPATLSTTLSFPPGYLRAFTYNLACELAPEFGVEPSIQVQKIAGTSKRDLKRINNPKDVMSLPDSLPLTGGSFNIYTGG